MTRQQSKISVALMVLCFLIFAAWLLGRPDHLKSASSVDRPSSLVAEDQSSVRSGEEKAQQTSLAIQNKIQMDVDRAKELSQEDIELSKPIDRERAKLDELRASNASDAQIKAEIIPSLLKLRAAAMKKHTIDVEVTSLLDDAISSVEQRQNLSAFPTTTPEKYKEGKQALVNWRRQMQASLQSSDDFLSVTNGLAEALTQ